MANLTHERFEALAEAYGGEIGRWPEADRDAALDLLRGRLRDGDVVLVKASRGVELDLLVEALRRELGREPR